MQEIDAKDRQIGTLGAGSWASGYGDTQEEGLGWSGQSWLRGEMGSGRRLSAERTKVGMTSQRDLFDAVVSSSAQLEYMHFAASHGQSTFHFEFFESLERSRRDFLGLITI